MLSGVLLNSWLRSAYTSSFKERHLHDNRDEIHWIYGKMLMK